MQITVNKSKSSISGLEDRNFSDDDGQSDDYRDDDNKSDILDQIKETLRNEYNYRQDTELIKFPSTDDY